MLAAFNRRWLSAAVGYAVVAVGTVSAATMVRGFVGYFEVFFALPAGLVVVACVAALTAVAIWGIGESLLAAAAVTALEIAGLVFVCVVAGDSLNDFAADWQSILPGMETARIIGVVSGAFLAFYAFIGFEDIVNIAEEVRQPERNLPRAILVSLAASTMLYVLVAIVASFAVAPGALAGSDAPLALIVQSRGFPPGIIAAISLFAVVNGALAQIIMASRVLYGLANERLAAALLARVNARTQTPIPSTLVIAAVVLTLALAFSLGGLARVTSFIALSIFTAVNLALLRLKCRGGRRPDFSVPAAVPAAGAILSVAMIAYEGLSFLR